MTEQQYADALKAIALLREELDVCIRDMREAIGMLADNDAYTCIKWMAQVEEAETALAATSTYTTK